MHFSVYSDDINYALGQVVRALPVRPSQDELAGVLIETEPDSLMLTCTDGEVSIRARVNATIDEDGVALLPAKLFSDLFRLQTPRDYDVRIDSGNGDDQTFSRARIHAVGTNTTMNCMAAENFPDINDISEQTCITLPCSAFKEAASRVLFALSTSDEETRRILTGVLVETRANETRLVGLDGFKLSLQKIYAENTVPEGKEKVSAIMPGRVMSEISKMLPDTDDPLEIKYNRTNVQFSFGSVQVGSPLLIGEYIDYNSIMPKSTATEMRVKRTELSSALERCRVVATEGKNSLVRFKIQSEGNLELSANSEKADVHEEINSLVQGNDLNIAFNVHFLIEILKNISDDDICMKFNSSISPCLVTPIEGDAYQYLVLPVRVFQK